MSDSAKGYPRTWQFGHVTASFVGRFLVGALILSYGMTKNNLLLIMAGLLLAIGFGALSRGWRLWPGRGFSPSWLRPR